MLAKLIKGTFYFKNFRFVCNHLTHTNVLLWTCLCVQNLYPAVTILFIGLVYSIYVSCRMAHNEKLYHAIISPIYIIEYIFSPFVDKKKVIIIIKYNGWWETLSRPYAMWKLLSFVQPPENEKVVFTKKVNSLNYKKINLKTNAHLYVKTLCVCLWWEAV